jgi:ABC-type proline/glycine betaine transport system permease subunit
MDRSDLYFLFLASVARILRKTSSGSRQVHSEMRDAGVGWLTRAMVSCEAITDMSESLMVT